MSPQKPILDLEAILTPISEDSPSGINLRPLGAYDDIKALRTTESSEGMVGALRAGEFKTAQWGKAITLCVKELSTRSKDLQIAVWLADSLVRVHGFRGLIAGLELIEGLHERFWATYYPPIEDGGLDMRAGRLAEMEKLLVQAIYDTPLTAKVEGESYRYVEWKRVQVLATNASRAKPEEKEAAMTEATTLREALDNAVAKTSWEFYDNILESVENSQQVVERLRNQLDELFSKDPAASEMESVTGFSDLRAELTECRIKLEGFLNAKPVPPGKQRRGAVEESTESEEGQADGTDGAQAAAGGGGGWSGGGGGMAAGVSGAIVTRAEALHRLTAIAEYFQKTEPHSPVSYLVQRAVRWGEMPLENWLEEVIADSTALNAIRDTLGLPKKTDSY